MGKKALIPLDGSGLAECALSHVRGLAKDGLPADLFPVQWGTIPACGSRDAYFSLWCFIAAWSGENIFAPPLAPSCNM